MPVFACCGFPGKLRLPGKDVRSASNDAESYVTSGDLIEGYPDALGMSGYFQEESVAANRGSLRDSTNSLNSGNLAQYARPGSTGRASHRSTDSSLQVVQEEVIHFRDKEAMIEEILRLRRALNITSRELVRTENELEDVLAQLFRERGQSLESRP